jgi:hypothetical protein
MTDVYPSGGELYVYESPRQVLNGLKDVWSFDVRSF